MIPVVDNLLGYFSSDLAIDLGTANTLVYVKNKGIVIREPSIVALHKKTKKIIAIGTAAKRMIGKTPLNIDVIRPLREGVISDYDTTLAMLSYFVKKVHDTPGKTFSMPRPHIVVGIPSQISEVQRRAVMDASQASGARETSLIEEPLAAALGAGLAVDEPVGTMIVDIGGGTCEIAVLSLGGIVVGRSLKVAGDEMDTAIANYVRTRWSLAIGEKTAEDIKVLLGSAYPLKQEKEMMVRGRDLEKGMPKTIRLTSTQVREALAVPINTILNAIRDTIEDTPPELTADIVQKGIYICGGGSLISGLAKLISQETKMPVTVCDEPLSCVVLGCARLLENKELLKKVKILDARDK